LRRILLLAAIAMIVAAACSAKQPEQQATSTTTEPRSDRLVVLDGDNDAVIVTADGAIVRRLTDAGDSTIVFQPIWAPDGASVAYGRFDGTDASVVVTKSDGEPVTEHALPAPVIYLSWGRTGALGWLRNDAERGLAFEAVSPDGDRVEDGGGPFYFAWSPDGTRLLAHVGVDRLDVIQFGGNAEAIGEPPGAFSAPWWTERGQIYLTQDATGQRLIIDDGSGPTVVARVRGSAQLGVAASRIAVRSFDPEGSGLAAALQQAPLIPPDRLNVLDLDTGALTDVAGPRTIAFFWSPGGDRLLLLEAMGDEAGAVRWVVWSPEGTTAYTEFFLEDSWVRDFLPFFDQYAQSVRLWSPDGSAFAFPGSVAGTQGIWVQELDAEAPTMIGEGTWVDWAPAGSGLP
jgi:TolB protein